MYSIGEVSKITGISRDRLRYYEEKGILCPGKNSSNGYREYGIDDIDRVLMIEFYRSMDLGIDLIHGICGSGSLEDIRLLVDRKKKEVDEELRELCRISDNIKGFLSDYEKIKDNLNRTTIRGMDDFVIYDEISDFRAYREYDKIHLSNKPDPATPIVRKLTRKLILEDGRITGNKMIITGPADGGRQTDSFEVCRPGRCLYTVREDFRGAGSLMEDIKRDFSCHIDEQGLQIRGDAYANMLVMAVDGGAMKSYLEIFLPLKS